jgi:hypothetical protein
MDGSKPVLIGEGDEEILKSKGIQLIGSNLIDIEKDYIRHDNIHLSEILMDIAQKKK